MDQPLETNGRAAATQWIKEALASGKPALDEWQSKALFAAYDIPVPAGVLVRSDIEAAAAAGRIGGRLVMKGIGAEIHHKTEAGLVVLGVEGAEAAAATYLLLAERAVGSLDAVLVEEMIAGSRELMVGMKRDPVFGPAVAFGLGGVLTEALGDVVLAIAPVDDRNAAELPDLIRARRLLGSFRGYPPVDRAALTKMIQAIGQMALDHPEIAEIDANPVLVQGDQPIAADALILLSPAPAADQEQRTFKSNVRALLAPRKM